LFSIFLGLLPVSGRGGISHLILPAVTMGGCAGGDYNEDGARFNVGGDPAGLRSDRASQRSSRKESFCFGMPCGMGLLPVITILGLQAGALLAGAIITETVFAWPGAGPPHGPGNQCTGLSAAAGLYPDNFFELHFDQSGD
jgi:peptide/nickel transport system permease protein